MRFIAGALCSSVNLLAAMIVLWALSSEPVVAACGILRPP
jgi:Zn ribbon nucleic-acid-binding protein